MENLGGCFITPGNDIIIDFDRIDVVPMTEYLLQPPLEA